MPKGSLKISVLCLVAFAFTARHAEASPIETPAVIDAGFITCIPNAGSGCIASNTTATTAVWRVVDILSPDFGYEESTAFINATLTFEYEGGLLSWSWPTITPLFVETSAFDFGLVQLLESLTFTATLEREILNFAFNDDFFVADTISLFATSTAFPPPLSINIDGTSVHPVPEPASFLLLGVGLAGTFLRRFRVRSG